MRTLIISLAALGSFLSLNAAELPVDLMERALAVMKSSDAEKRKAAYRTFQHLGVEAMPGYRKVLERAKLHHQGAMRRGMGVRGNPYAEHVRVAEELAAGRKRVMALIHTDWQKDVGKIRMLAKELDRVGRKYKKQENLLESKAESIDRNVGTAFQALVEIQWELASLDRSEDGENASELPDKEQLKDLVCQESFEADEWRKQKEKWESTQKSVNARESAQRHNAACKWANASQRDFSDHLNHQRAVMGLPALLLEERLSVAASGHSKDMRTGGFFSHTSPVPGKKTPSDRARKARFPGRWTGENIYMGSPSHVSAYNGWFGSDGHRFIMFTKGGSNVIGVGVDGGYWTMMTGQM